MARLALLLAGPRVHVRVRSAVGTHHELNSVESWSELEAAFERNSADGCVIDLFHPSEPVSLDALSALRKRHPFAALVVYSNFNGRETDLFELGALGVNEVILAERQESSRDIARAIQAAFTSSVTIRVTSMIEGRVHPVAVRALQWGISHAMDEAPAVATFARGLGYDLPQLQRLLRSEGLPTPSGFLIWGRAFTAINLIETTQKTREDVAFSVGYVSMAGLNRAFKSAAGYTVEQVLKRGAIAFLVERFLDRHESSAAPGS